MKDISVIAVVGATATGKTDLAIEICKKFNGEIVSADSMQIYKKLDIGTAKPTKEQLNTIKHHMIDILEPYENFSVKQYCDMAHLVIKDIDTKKKLPLIVGGTGLYVDSLTQGLKFPEHEANLELREKLKKRIEFEGTDKLLKELSEFDSEYAQSLIVERNPKRLIRAIEIYKTTGISMSEHIRKSKLNTIKYKTMFVYLGFRDRSLLYEKINKRVDYMVSIGLIDEAKMVYETHNISDTAKKAIGYKEFFPYFEGNRSLEECISELKKASRRYAKRQITWFARNKNLCHIYIDEYSDLSEIKSEIFNRIKIFCEGDF